MNTVADATADPTCGHWLPPVAVPDNDGDCEGTDVDFNQAL